MNEFLAQLYDTSENIGASSSNDVEKLAQATVVDQLIKSEGLSIDDVPAATILKIAEDLFGPNNQIQKTAEESAAHEESEKKKKDGEGKEETVEEKMAQADFLGRQMAHAYVNELATIEKDAGKAEIIAKGKELAGKAWTGLKGAGTKATEAVKGAVGKPGERYRTAYEELRTNPSRLKGLGEAAKKLKPELVGGTLALGGVGAGVHHALKKKESSAIDMLAEKRAYEILAENGLVEQGPSQEEVKLANAVEEKAWELLNANGYVRQE